MNIINLSRFQFALTSMFHFLFVSITLGLSILIAILETIYVYKNDKSYKYLAKFLGKIFSINFALGIATGLIMEFQFGTNWSYFSKYAGDIFGFPLVMEGLIAFFLESTFIGLFLFGWNKLSKINHLIITWLIVLGSSLSALWIISANGWMQYPVGYKFNIENMRLEVNNFTDILLNRTSQLKFSHTISSSYCVGSSIGLAISSYFLIKKKFLDLSKKLFVTSSIFCFLFIILTIIFGDESGYELHKTQKAKLSSIESEWDTQKPPASLNLFAIPSQKYKKNFFSIKIPYILGLLSTRSLNKKVIGLKDILKSNKIKIINGIKAIKMLRRIKNGNNTKENIDIFNKYSKFLGYGLLYEKYNKNLNSINNKSINEVLDKTIPNVLPIFFSFRIMVLSGIFIFSTLLLCIHKIFTNNFLEKMWIYKMSILVFPFSILATQCGWFVSEYGRQPWIIYNLLPTVSGCSSLNINQVIFTVTLISSLYVIFLFLWIYLNIKIINNGFINKK